MNTEKIAELLIKEADFYIRESGDVEQLFSSIVLNEDPHLSNLEKEIDGNYKVKIRTSGWKNETIDGEIKSMYGVVLKMDVDGVSVERFSKEYRDIIIDVINKARDLYDQKGEEIEEMRKNYAEILGVDPRNVYIT